MKIASDRGGALIESVGFVTVAFSLLLSSGLELFKIEQQQLELSSIARNSLREYLLNPTENLEEIVAKWQSLSSDFDASQLEFNVECSAYCTTPGALIKFQLRSDNLAVNAFAISQVQK